VGFGVHYAPDCIVFASGFERGTESRAVRVSRRRTQRLHFGTGPTACRACTYPTSTGVPTSSCRAEPGREPDLEHHTQSRPRRVRRSPPSSRHRCDRPRTVEVTPEAESRRGWTSSRQPPRLDRDADCHAGTTTNAGQTTAGARPRDEWIPARARFAYSTTSIRAGAPATTPD